jgi:hypothetical protein
VQEGYRFSLAVASKSAIFEYDWNLPNNPVPRGIYEAPENANTKIIKDCQINFAYIMISLEYETFFLQRNQHQISNAAYIINYRPNPQFITKLLYNDFVVSIMPGVTDIINLTPAYLSLNVNQVGSTTVQLVAKSEDANAFTSCTASLTVTGVEPGDTNIYQTNINVKTLFDGFPNRQYSFPIDSPFAGSNIDYQLQSFGESKPATNGGSQKKPE